MCDQTKIEYLDGDIVWVKLGPCWWPGEVWDESRLPEDTLRGLKKAPFAVVRFFEEETFGFVKTVSDIYRYNCSRKDEFIKKGLDKYRAKNKYMEKFPNDIQKAEELTGGNPKIIDDAKYAPSPKLSYNDLYGSPAPKKKKSLKETSSNKASPLRKSTSATSTPNSDWTPQSKTSTYTPGSSQYSSPTSTSEKKYNCYQCDYKTDRINLIIIHLKQHSANRKNNGSPLVLKTSDNTSNIYETPTRVSGISRTTPLQDDSKSTTKSPNKDTKKGSSTKGKMSPGITPKGKKRGRSKKTDVEASAKKVKTTDHEIRSKLLADWLDDQDSDLEDTAKEKSIDQGVITEDQSNNEVTETENISMSDILSKAEDDTPLPVEIEQTTSEKEQQPISTPIEQHPILIPTEKEQLNSTPTEKKSVSTSEEGDITTSRTNSIDKSEDEGKSKSCFDFEEDDIIDVPKSPGRKIPRLITKKTRKEFVYTPEPADLSLVEKKQENSTKAMALDVTDPVKQSDTTEQNDSNNFDLDIDDILNKTKVPELPEMPQEKLIDNVEVQQHKPVREIMSPKERGKRIFKSKQIFKTRMQEKYGNDIKPLNHEITLVEAKTKDDLNSNVSIPTEQETNNLGNVELGEMSIDDIRDIIGITNKPTLVESDTKVNDMEEKCTNINIQETSENEVKSTSNITTQETNEKEDQSTTDIAIQETNEKEDQSTTDITIQETSAKEDQSTTNIPIQEISAKENKDTSNIATQETSENEDMYDHNIMTPEIEDRKENYSVMPISESNEKEQECVNITIPHANEKEEESVTSAVEEIKLPENSALIKTNEILKEESTPMHLDTEKSVSDEIIKANVEDPKSNDINSENLSLPASIEDSKSDDTKCDENLSLINIEEPKLHCATTEKIEPLSFAEEPKSSEVTSDENLSLYSITSDVVQVNDKTVSGKLSKKRKSSSSTNDIKSFRIEDIPLPSTQETDTQVKDNHLTNSTESIQKPETTLTDLVSKTENMSEFTNKLAVTEENKSDIIDDEQLIKTTKIDNTIAAAECLINFSESISSENLVEQPKSPIKSDSSNSIKRSPTSPKKVKPQFGLGSIDASEPLKVEQKKVKKKDEMKIAPNNLDNANKPEPEGQKMEVTDIQSYITNKTQTQDHILKPPVQSRLHNILTESPCTSALLHSKDIIKNSTPNTKHPKVSDININPKKQFIKMRNEKKELVNKDTFKSAIDQIEEIETFIIEKPKPSTVDNDMISHQPQVQVPSKSSEPKIVKKPARKPAIISKKQIAIKNVLQDDSMFDINSMPIVLSDQIIPNNSLDQMQLVLSESDETGMIIDNNLFILDNTQEVAKKVEQKPISPKGIQTMQVLKKIENPNTILIQKAVSSSSSLIKNQRVYQSPTKTKILKQNPTVITQPGKPGKFIVIPSSSAQTGSKYTVGKRSQQKSLIVKTTVSSNTNQVSGKEVSQSPKPIIQKIINQKVNVDSAGNTVLFITNSNGEQSKVVLTPDSKTKSSVTPQTIVTSKGAIINPKQSPAIISKPSQLLLTSKGQIISRPNVQSTKISSVGIKQKVAQAVVTSKSSLVTSKLILAPGQIIQPNQIILNKGKVLTTLSTNELKKGKSLTGPSKIIINKKVSKQPSMLIKDQSVVKQVPKPISPEKPKPQGQKKGFVKLSPQQLAEMEKLGFVTETSHGKIITQEGIKHMQTMTQDIKIQSFPPQKKVKPPVTIKKVNPLAIENPKIIQQKPIIKQVSVPPLTSLSDSKSIFTQETLYQKEVETPVQHDIVQSENKDCQDVSESAEQAPATAVPESNISTSIVQEPTLSSLSEAQLLAVPGETFNGPLGSFFLCSVGENGNLTPVDSQPLYLDANNQLVPAGSAIQDNVLSGTEEETTLPATAEPSSVTPAQIDMSLEGLENQQIIINADGQQFILDQQSLLALSEQQILTTDGQQLILQGNAQQILAALAGGQDVNMLEDNTLSVSENVTYQHEFSNKDILATALANTNVFQNDATNSDLDMYQNLQNDLKHSRVSETSSGLQPIMSPLELPSKKPEDNEKIEGMNFTQNIDDSLAVIGVNSTNIPTSLDLPITITNPEIAPKSTNPLNLACEMLYQTASYSPVTSKELSSGDIFQASEVPGSHQPENLSMPDLMNDCKEEEVNKSNCSEPSFSSESLPLLNESVEAEIHTEINLNITNNRKMSTENQISEEIEPKISQTDTDTEYNKLQEEMDVQSTVEEKMDVQPTVEEEIIDQSVKSAQFENKCDNDNNSHDPVEMDIEKNDDICTESVINNKNGKVDLSNSFDDKLPAIENTPTELSESVACLQVDDKEISASESINTQKNIIKSPSREIEEKLVDTNNSSEINIITEGLTFESEQTDLLTPSTIAETITSPRSLGDVPQDFCESSNSCDIPIQPNLIYSSNHEINDNDANIMNDAKKENELTKDSNDKIAEENDVFDTR